jgi:hypothetical protein
VLTELSRKGGRLCHLAREGHLHCPLIIRPTSEDVITGHLVQTLRLLNPRHYVSDLLNAGLGSARFRRQVYRRFRIDPWVNKPCYPRELLYWDEGSTQVDIQLTWENPPTTVYIEAKYGSELSLHTSGDDRQSGYSSDQLSRCVRVGLLECGYFREERLFPLVTRDFVVLVFSPGQDDPLVREYRDPRRLLEVIPHNDRIACLPRLPFIGQLSFADVRRVLRQRMRWFTRPEQTAITLLDDYLAFKQTTCPRPGRGIVASGENLFDIEG